MGVYLGSVRSAWAISPGEFGSYSVNGWLVDLAPDPDGFHTLADIVRPAMTPVLGDALAVEAFPSASDFPSTDFSADGRTFGPGMPAPDMRAFAIPRHGSCPNPVPTQWPLNTPLPGAANVSFIDGHGELVKLDHLWQLYWHADYQPPAKRPGFAMSLDIDLPRKQSNKMKSQIQNQKWQATVGFTLIELLVVIATIAIIAGMLQGRTCAYMIGQLRILELREKAMKKLGAQFDIKQFHNTVLSVGRVPLDVLEQVADARIAEKKRLN